MYFKFVLVVLFAIILFRLLNIQTWTPKQLVFSPPSALNLISTRCIRRTRVLFEVRLSSKNNISIDFKAMMTKFKNGQMKINEICYALTEPCIKFQEMF